MSPSAPLTPDQRRALEATLRFAEASGAWILAGEVSGPTAGTSSVERSPVQARPEVSSPAKSSGEDAAASLARVRAELGECTRCRLAQGRTHLVFGVGDPAARVVFVGEGPGEEEDRRGEPFVGRAGQLLDRMLRAIGLERSRVYIANVVKCRPPANRTPYPDEAETCLPFLWGQLEAIRPATVCALGGQAAKYLLGAETPISRLRGKPQQVRGMTVLPTFHPAYLLRNPGAKRLAWEDLKRLRALLAEGL